MRKLMSSTNELPSGYILDFRVDLQKEKKKALLINILALLIAAVMVVIGLRFEPLFNLFTFEDGALMYILRFLAIIIGSILYIVLHEAVHGIFMKLFSNKKVKYGFTGLYAYAGSDAYFCRRAYIIIALAPVVIWGVVLAVLSFVVSSSWFWVVYIIQISNISGAAGDIYVTCKFMTLPKDILIQDSGVSMNVYKKET